MPEDLNRRGVSWYLDFAGHVDLERSVGFHECGKLDSVVQEKGEGFHECGKLDSVGHEW